MLSDATWSADPMVINCWILHLAVSRDLVLLPRVQISL
jgi:hypothetical protein